ncbi:hypothetical protein I6M39_07615 [Shewanella algae]|uniref:hypothetical protein n=1 Tax=Shewanella algae TaxID=38313 RepID=UPI001AAC4BF9|nr:hypothetical protein [Shewanella algae]MBO2568871.1 hypothetical protein [Shewanella algae]
MNKNTTSQIFSTQQQFVNSHYLQLCESLELFGMKPEAERILLAKEMDYPIAPLFYDALLRLSERLLIERVAQPLRTGPKPRVQAEVESQEYDLCCSEDDWERANQPELMGLKALKSLRSFVSNPEIQHHLFLKPDLAGKVHIHRQRTKAEFEEDTVDRGYRSYLLAPAKEYIVVSSVFVEPLSLLENIFSITITY